jgi:hypothetical protein
MGAMLAAMEIGSAILNGVAHVEVWRFNSLEGKGNGKSVGDGVD